MTYTIRVHANPLDFSDVTHGVHDGGSLEDVVCSQGLNRKFVPVIAAVNGRLVRQAEWATRLVTKSDVVTLQVLPGRGGGGSGGGGGNKQILASVLMIAITVVAWAVAGPIAAGIGLGTSALAVGAVAATLVVAGSLVVNALIPPQRASQGNYGAASGANINPSPVYTLNARSNTARLGQPIPVVYGRHLTYPDYASTPWWEYVDNNQFLYQLLVVGHGEYVLEEPKIGSAPFSSYEEISYTVYAPGEEVTMFDVNVYTSPDVAGQTLLGDNELTVGIDGWVGPFPACPPDSVCTDIGIDIIFSRGLYGVSGSSLISQAVTWEIQVRKVDSNGAPEGAGDWTTLPTETFSAAEATPQRLSYRYAMAESARWEARLHRVGDKSESINVADEISWGGLRGYLDDGVLSFESVTTIAVRMRATNNLSNNNANRVSVIATRKLRQFTVGLNGEVSWSAPVPTREIAPVVADILTNSVYGGNVSEDRIDFSGLSALHAVLTQRGDTFDAVFDQPTTVWEALGRVLRCGRAERYYQAGMVRFRRDEPQSLYAGVFSHSNIVTGSLSMTFVMPTTDDAVDGIEGEFMEERTWRPGLVRHGVAGETPTRYAREQLFGVVTRSHADREASYMAAANRYRRVFVTFRTELEGRIPSFGDPILLSHEVPKWGKSGNVVSWDQDNLIVELADDFDLVLTQSNYVWFRSKNGKPSNAVVVVEKVAPFFYKLMSSPIVLGTSTSFEFVVDGSSEPTHYLFGTSEDTPKKVIVTSIVPRGDTVEIVGVLDDERVHVN